MVDPGVPGRREATGVWLQYCRGLSWVGEVQILLPTLVLRWNDPISTGHLGSYNETQVSRGWLVRL